MHSSKYPFSFLPLKSQLFSNVVRLLPQIYYNHHSFPRSCLCSHLSPSPHRACMSFALHHCALILTIYLISFFTL
ncbi:hypothetical protein KSS87_022225 [Heliosperma pusillum]|nr:hypothetical protein KSS87_022225 [Heliosperma pusillum]